jgi:hypothetical protein
MQDAAKELYDARQFKESIEGYEKAELYCEVALQRPEHEHKGEVQKLHAICKLNRSLCYFQSQQYEQSYHCSIEVFRHQYADSTSKLKAVIRAGQSLSKLCAKAGEEDKRTYLNKALVYCGVAEKMIAADANLQSNSSFSVSLKQLQKEIVDKQPKTATTIDYSKGFRTLPDVPSAQQSRGTPSPTARSAPSTISRRNQGSDNETSSDSDSSDQQRQAAVNKRRNATSIYPNVAFSDDVYGKSPYAFSRQRLARYPGIRNEGATCWGNCILQVIFHLRALRVRLRQVAHQILQQGSSFEQGAVVRILLFVFDNMESRTAAPGEEAFDSVSALSLWRTCETNVRAARAVCCRLRAIDSVIRC